MKIILIALSLCSARSLSRHIQQTVQLYSMETGRHLAISPRRVGSTKKTNSKLAEIEMISVSGSEFILKGSQTGLFVSNAARRLRVTHDKENATKFSEELIESNQYSKYKIANSNCFLTVRKNGKTQISCKETQSNTSFLPRRVHQRKVSRGQKF